jgi:triacylglycerol esterase/lipase EstA (alpha/beta hydrolase family)
MEVDVRAAPFGGLLRRVLVALAVAVSLCGACAANAFAAGGQKPVVVIVPGLDMAVPGMSPSSGGCGGQGSLGSLCQAYVDQGYNVYIPSTSTTGNGTVINSAGNVATNASALSGYVNNIESQNNGADVSAVGYSMGGLMIVDAVRDNGMAVNSVVTIGSPLDGSFVADGLTAAANQTCFSLGCMAVSAGAQIAINQTGPDAISSLTSSDRAAENSGQGPLGVPVTTIAGNGCGIAGDCAVAVSSAYGTGSNLGPTSQMTVDDVHTGGPGGALTVMCGGCSPELNDPTVAKTAVKASQTGCASSAYCIPQAQLERADTAVARDRRLAGDARPRKAPENVKLTLDTTSFVSVAAGASQTITGADLIASTSPYAAACAGAAPVAPSASASLYYTDPVATLGCAPNVVTVQNTGSQAIDAEIFSNPAAARATVGARGGTVVPIVVSAKVGITNVKIVTDAGKVLKTVRGDGRRTVTFLAPRTLASQNILSATLSGQTAAFSAAIPQLPAALAKATVTVRPGRVRSGQTVTISGRRWAAGDVSLTLLAEGADHYVLANLRAQANAQGSFTLTFTAPSDIDSRTPVALTAGEPQRAPAKATFTITQAPHH